MVSWKACDFFKVDILSLAKRTWAQHGLDCVDETQEIVEAAWRHNGNGAGLHGALHFGRLDCNEGQWHEASALRKHRRYGPGGGEETQHPETFRDGRRWQKNTCSL